VIAETAERPHIDGEDDHPAVGLANSHTNPKR
jgi:hypothetical protein